AVADGVGARCKRAEPDHGTRQGTAGPWHVRLDHFENRTENPGMHQTSPEDRTQSRPSGSETPPSSSAVAGRTAEKTVPVYRELLADLETPLTAYLKVAGHPSFLLESV